MKPLIMIAAFLTSAALVLPTVTQAQTDLLAATSSAAALEGQA